MSQLDSELDEDKLSRLAELSFDAPNDGTAGNQLDHSSIRREVRRIYSQESRGRLADQWSHVCEILCSWLSQDQPKAAAEAGLFLAWDLVIRHTTAARGHEKDLIEACLCLGAGDTFQTRTGSSALLAFIAEVTSDPAAIMGTLRDVARFRLEDDALLPKRKERIMTITMVVLAILIIRMDLEDINQAMPDMRQLIMKVSRLVVILLRGKTDEMRSDIGYQLAWSSWNTRTRSDFHLAHFDR